MNNIAIWSHRYSDTARRKIHQEQRQSQSVQFDALLVKQPASLQRSMEVASETGTLIHMLPIQENGFTSHKREMLLAWQPPLLLSNCVCGSTFSVEHALYWLSMPYTGCPSIRHNELRDISAIATYVNVGTEPCLQPLSGEFLKYKTATVVDDARLDIFCRFFLESQPFRIFFAEFFGQKTYLDVKVFNPFTKSYTKDDSVLSTSRTGQETSLWSN